MLLAPRVAVHRTATLEFEAAFCWGRRTPKFRQVGEHLLERRFDRRDIRLTVVAAINFRQISGTSRILAAPWPHAQSRRLRFSRGLGEATASRRARRLAPAAPPPFLRPRPPSLGR